MKSASGSRSAPPPARVVRTVTQRSLVWCAIGIIAGTAISFAIARALGSYYEFSDVDPVAILASCVVLAVVALLASYLPARRAARVDPAVTLRAEEPGLGVLSQLGRCWGSDQRAN